MEPNLHLGWLRWARLQHSYRLHVSRSLLSLSSDVSSGTVCKSMETSSSITWFGLDVSQARVTCDVGLQTMQTASQPGASSRRDVDRPRLRVGL
jgi:hypothetical protein